VRLNISPEKFESMVATDALQKHIYVNQWNYEELIAIAGIKN